MAQLQPIPEAEQRKPKSVVEMVETTGMYTNGIPDEAPILVVREPWYSLLLDGVKRWEIRGEACRKGPGTSGACCSNTSLHNSAHLSDKSCAEVRGSVPGAAAGAWCPWVLAPLRVIDTHIHTRIRTSTRTQSCRLSPG